MLYVVSTKHRRCMLTFCHFIVCEIWRTIFFPHAWCLACLSIATYAFDILDKCRFQHRFLIWALSRPHGSSTWPFCSASSRLLWSKNAKVFNVGVLSVLACKSSTNRVVRSQAAFVRHKRTAHHQERACCSNQKKSNQAIIFHAIHIVHGQNICSEYIFHPRGLA